jgi:hypothetical protein
LEEAGGCEEVAVLVWGERPEDNIGIMVRLLSVAAAFFMAFGWAFGWAFGLAGFVMHNH